MTVEPNIEGLSIEESAELRAAFIDTVNYASEDPLEPIDPVAYRAPDGDTCLHIAGRRDDLRAAHLLLRAGADVNSIGDMGLTPLHCARSSKMAALLIASGASLEVVDEFGLLPLDRLERDADEKSPWAL